MEQNLVLQVIQQRHSVRSYIDAPVNDDDIMTILRAGWAAPYAGDQQCYFAVVQDGASRKRINEWSKQGAAVLGIPELLPLCQDPTYDCMYGAPVLVVVASREEAVGPDLDAAAATQNMLIAAQSLGLSTCWLHFPLFTMYTEHAAAFRELLKIPEGYKPCATFVLGYAEQDATQDERDLGAYSII